MKDLHATASATVAASPEQVTTLLAAIDDYPRWHPDLIRRAETVERSADGTPVRARATVHLALGPLVRDFELPLAVAVRPGYSVTLTRVAHEPSDPERFEVNWRVEPGSPTQLRLELEARIDVPRLLPVGTLGEQLAQGFVDAASRAVEGSSPNASASSS
jgi:ribosome-associated toxin RatA of RatAB toxin-antitoxin module